MHEGKHGILDGEKDLDAIFKKKKPEDKKQSGGDKHSQEHKDSHGK